MSSSITSIEEIFGKNGPIARTLPGFEGRSGQVRTAQLIERGFLEETHTIVEAGTGVGKSFAYLVPALRSGKKIVISTGTIALQEQLVRKDIPMMLRALGSSARIELLKGRNHYLCRSKLDRLVAERDRHTDAAPLLFEDTVLPPVISRDAPMDRLLSWGKRTHAGDRAELPFMPSAREWEALDADADDCVGEHCDRFRDCWYFARRDAARCADLVVVNHALFFLDLALSGGLLPSYDYAILDEAHQCERWATAALTATLSPSGVGRMLRRLHRAYHVPPAHDIEIDGAMRSLQETLSRVSGERYPLKENEAARAPLNALHGAFSHLENWLMANWQSAARRHTENPLEAERRRDLMLRGITAHIGTVERTMSPDDEIVSWVERSEGERRYQVNAAPCDVAGHLRATLFKRVRSVALLSATLANENSFSLARSALGIDIAEEYIAPSPFDYAKQARLYVAPPHCNPKDSDFVAKVAPLVEELLDITSGRAFVLFTSYNRLRELHESLRDRLVFPVRLQGEAPREQLLDWFRSTENAVLFATGAFWEGIDVVGDRLSCVIIDRLPFPSPSDPLVAARLNAIEASGRSGFEEYMIPSAIVRLKQGFGRLIRSKNDRGVVALLDGRTGAMRYGATILAALPPARRVKELDELRGFLST